MALGLSLGLTLSGRMAGGSASPFSPESLFASGEAGAWYDASDLSTLFQNSDGTTAASVGDPVGYIADKSGNGNHATQATAAARPTLQQTAGGLYYLDFDGVDDSLEALFTIAQPWTRVSGLTLDAIDSGSQVIGGGTENDGVLYYSNTERLTLFSGAVGPFITVAAGNTFVASEVHNGASSSIKKNDETAVTGNAGSDVPGGITLSARQGGSSSTDTSIYSLVMVGRTITEQEGTDLRSYTAGKTGVTL